VNKLWFPVKLGPISTDVLRARLFAAALVGLTACGYRPAYGGTRPAVRYSVAAAPARSPESGALVAVLEGLRGELSKSGVLGPDTGYPRVVVELVRVDERGTAQSLSIQPNSGVELPIASGSLVGVTARAWVEGGPKIVERDTGDVRRTSAFGSAGSPILDAARREAAMNNAGRATGTALGRRVLGEIEVAQEPM